MQESGLLIEGLISSANTLTNNKSHASEVVWELVRYLLRLENYDEHKGEIFVEKKIKKTIIETTEVSVAITMAGWQVIRDLFQVDEHGNRPNLKSAQNREEIKGLGAKIELLAIQLVESINQQLRTRGNN